MKVEAFLIFFLPCLSGLRRGPHHPHGQMPLESHSHYKPKHSDSLTKDTQLLHDAKHLEEDVKVLTAEAIAKMTPEELEFHYFSAHDYDRNSLLDGLEMLKAVYHTIEHAAPDPEEDEDIEPESDNLELYIALVDKTLKSDDTNNDGYVSYAEYRAARGNTTEDRSPRVLAGNAG
ncbi:unnamed protein product [Danaus chrysippus]|uniref:(African queen) hypothetical protein n=1 Tax=Danaus chrysippus TaxID=151541 RepID=A0A8J2R9M1_9NEOP|nr:unnamed protein product [Danaus chrysippus]